MRYGLLLLFALVVLMAGCRKESAKNLWCSKLHFGTITFTTEKEGLFVINILSDSSAFPPLKGYGLSYSSTPPVHNERTVTDTLASGCYYINVHYWAASTVIPPDTSMKFPVCIADCYTKQITFNW
jgi:hypothetical protein